MIKIIQKGGEVLRKIAKEVPLDCIKGIEVQNAIKKMRQAISENEEAVAIAAPQIGKSLRIFVISEYVDSKTNFESRSPSSSRKKVDYGYFTFINPKILKKSRTQKILSEGCLSVEGVYGAVKRSEKIKLEAYDENGKKFIKIGSGLFSQVIQHEMDHLDGVLFADKAIMLKKYEKQSP